MSTKARVSAPAERDAAPDQIDPAVASVIDLVGRRVREARKAQGLSRRIVSERSGVSPRYLAKLEAGDGNISIGLLKRVAVALSVPLDAFLIEDGPLAAEVAQMAELYRRADAATRTQVMQVLDPDRMRAQKAGRLCLVGLRGAGKSTLGARVGAALDVPFVELNAMIEEDAGIPIGEIIALYGQEGYRQLEADTLSAIVDGYPRAIVAVAGGIVSEPDTFHTVMSRFHTVWVKAAAGGTHGPRACARRHAPNGRKPAGHDPAAPDARSAQSDG